MKRVAIAFYVDVVSLGVLVGFRSNSSSFTSLLTSYISAPSSSSFPSLAVNAPNPSWVLARQRARPLPVPTVCLVENRDSATRTDHERCHNDP